MQDFAWIGQKIREIFLVTAVKMRKAGEGFYKDLDKLSSAIQI
jgi:hypothetical protein